jgi:hypothetical protein
MGVEGFIARMGTVDLLQDGVLRRTPCIDQETPFRHATPEGSEVAGHGQRRSPGGPVETPATPTQVLAFRAEPPREDSSSVFAHGSESTRARGESEQGRVSVAGLTFCKTRGPRTPMGACMWVEEANARCRVLCVRLRR